MKYKRKNIVLRIFVIFIMVVLGSFTYVNAYLNKINKVDITKDNEKLGIKVKDNIDKNEEKSSGEEVINIALFGGDRRKINDVVHSDAIMILTIDNLHKKIKLSSIMRDTYVNVYEHGMTKITHAYGYGGPELAIRTLNENFNLNIRDYGFVDFYGFKNLVDALGGIDVEIKKYEIKEMNKYIKELADIKDTRPTLIKKSGMNHLNGEQALSYSRIRKVGDGDFERTDRQRRVMEILFEKMKNIEISKYPSVIDAILPNIETSLSKMDILKLSACVLSWDNENIEQSRFPTDEYYKQRKIDGVYYIVADLNETKKQMHDFIYKDEL
ncbi:LCP family protein [Tissierella sp. MSJ-40]|uniref:LCP family protein n=1 Tax=Tissierella simiarum TaxID=2841534 RepID=A0ABS6E4U3_9FIRM|nr:LCP family protein [Tissierella simiarum]MBU5437779.1 LCP family protein [Tissierella simiarum]